MSEIEVPLKPLGREDIQKLEAVLLLATVSRKDVIEKMRSGDPKDRITWIDSLAVAAGALAREKAGMSTSRIADELGRGEQTIRAHLTGKTEAGKLVRETYEMLLKGEKVLSFIFRETEISSKEEIEKLKAEIEKERKEKNELQEKLNKIQNKLENTIKVLEQILSQLKA
ncbi:MAG: transcriptional regulator [Candidatus Verstraetearchaeota archaeon]|nr:transcriptional regulator [Candidatus Verstraetearchaeota archaeon]